MDIIFPFSIHFSVKVADRIRWHIRDHFQDKVVVIWTAIRIARFDVLADGEIFKIPQNDFETGLFNYHIRRFATQDDFIERGGEVSDLIDQNNAQDSPDHFRPDV